MELKGLKLLAKNKVVERITIYEDERNEFFIEVKLGTGEISSLTKSRGNLRKFKSLDAAWKLVDELENSEYIPTTIKKQLLYLS